MRLLSTSKITNEVPKHKNNANKAAKYKKIANELVKQMNNAHKAAKHQNSCK